MVQRKFGRPCGTEESPTLPPRCISAEGVWAKFTREQGLDARLHCYGTQHGDPINTKCLFFLDVGRMPAASRESIQFHMVSYI